MTAVEEYEQRLQARQSRVVQHEKVHIRLGNLRLVLVVIGAVIAWGAFHKHMVSPAWLLLPAALFIAVTAYHSRVLRALDLARRAVSFYRNGLVRLADRWPGTGQSGERFDDPHHVYASDLDLFGRGSLFELLSTARTRMGEDTLARWLLSPSTLEQIRPRHSAVAELRSQLDLAEDLAVLGEDARVGVHPEALTHWAESPNRMAPEWLRWAAPVLAASAVASVVVWGFWGMATPLIVVVVVEAVLIYRLRSPLDAVLHSAEHAFHDLEHLSGLLARLERETFRAPRLQELQRELSSHHMAGWQAVARLQTIVDLIESRDNFMVRVLDAPLMYSVQVAFAAERWRRAHGQAVRTWLRATGEIEALLSLATYSYEHPSRHLSRVY